MSSGSTSNGEGHVATSNEETPVSLPDSEYDLINEGSMNASFPDDSRAADDSVVAIESDTKEQVGKSLSDEDLSLSFVVLSKDDGEEISYKSDSEHVDEIVNTHDKENNDAIRERGLKDELQVGVNDSELFSLVNVDSMEKEDDYTDERAADSGSEETSPDTSRPEHDEFPVKEVIADIKSEEKSTDVGGAELEEYPVRENVTVGECDGFENRTNVVLQQADSPQMHLESKGGTGHDQYDTTDADISYVDSLKNLDEFANNDKQQQTDVDEGKQQSIESEKMSFVQVDGFELMKDTSIKDMHKRSMTVNEILEDISVDEIEKRGNEDESGTSGIQFSSFDSVSTPSQRDTCEDGQSLSLSDTDVQTCQTENGKTGEHGISRKSTSVSQQAVLLEQQDGLNDRQLKVARLDNHSEAETSFTEEVSKPSDAGSSKQNSDNGDDREDVTDAKDVTEPISSQNVASNQKEHLHDPIEFEPTFIIKNIPMDKEITIEKENDSLLMNRKSPTNVVGGRSKEAEEDWSAVDEGPANNLPGVSKQSKEDVKQTQPLEISRGLETEAREKPVPKPRAPQILDRKEIDYEQATRDKDETQPFKLTGRGKDPGPAVAAGNGQQEPSLTADQSVRQKALSRLRQAQTYDIEGEDQEDNTALRRRNAHERFEYFWKADDIYSQWFPAEFVIDGKRFSSGEQYMMFKKAELFDDGEMMEMMMKTSDPQKIKQYGRRVKNFDERFWRDCSLYYVRDGVKEKFSQNAEMRVILFDTWPRILVEASPVDAIWGIGCSVEDPDAYQETTWRGLNLLGYVITEVRDAMMYQEGKLKQEHKQVTLEQLKVLFEFGELPPINTNIRK